MSETTRPLTARVAKHDAASTCILQQADLILAGEAVFALPDGTKAEEP